MRCGVAKTVMRVGDTFRPLRCRIAPLLCYGADTGSAPMDALMKIVEWMLLGHILLLEIYWADNYILSAPHELQSLPMRHLYLSLPAAHPVFITQRNWWQLVHFSFGSDADSMFFTACFNSSFIFNHYFLLLPAMCYHEIFHTLQPQRKNSCRNGPSGKCLSQHRHHSRNP